ncbi:MAG: tryptophan--tRNA ligase [Bdellovibrionales bacterium]
MSQPIVLTGIKPTGIPHLGNYVGAIKPAIALSREGGRTFMFIADYHALNQVHDAAQLTQFSRTIAATFLALGLDPERTIFYRQSDIPEIPEFATILSAVTPKGLMNRSHAYKAELDRNSQAGKEDLDIGINMGLYTYPILMSADILLFDTDLVPVGKDQVQHVEFARDIAGHFNRYYGEILKLPAHVISAQAANIPGLDGRKMSKSYNNIIPLFEEPAALKKLIMKIATDSKRPEEPKDPDNSTLFQLYTQFASEDRVVELRNAFLKGGMGYGEAKNLLFEAIDSTLSEPRRIFGELMRDTARLNAILKAGAEKARAIATPNLRKVREAIGVRPL